MSSDIARKLVRQFQQYYKPEVNYHVIPKKQILELPPKGLMYKEVADPLHISISTLKRHIYYMYEKLHVDNCIEAIDKVLGKDRF